MIKSYNVIINGKNFYDQAIDLDIEEYEEIRKLPTGQGEDYTTGCLLNYDYIKIIIVAKRTRCWSKSVSTNRICWAIKKCRWHKC